MNYKILLVLILVIIFNLKYLINLSIYILNNETKSIYELIFSRESIISIFSVIISLILILAIVRVRVRNKTINKILKKIGDIFNKRIEY